MFDRISKDLDKELSALKHGPVRVSASDVYPLPEHASVQLVFANGSRLRAEYWRITKDGKAGISSFDHRQQYGLPAPIDAIEKLKEQLQDKIVADVTWDKKTGDLLLRFIDQIELQVFNFTGYEMWEISFPDGTVQYSNYAK